MYSSSTRVGGVIVIFGVGRMIMGKTLGAYSMVLSEYADIMKVHSV